MFFSQIVLAADFTKTLTYADGIFNDVKSTSWYAKEVASAYELGFMNGKAEGQFVPDGNVTVAEAITMASRVHSIYNGKEIAKVDGGKWYDMYVNYALSNGIITEGQYENFDRNIMRYEMAVMFADSMPESYFAAKNDVKSIPDVNENEEYHDKLMMLYNAGVVMGSTEYGDFLATNSIKRSETAAIINRVALAENRLSKTLKEYGDREQAFFLIDDFEMSKEVRGTFALASGWDYENTGIDARDISGHTTNGLADSSEHNFVAIHRPITAQTCGVVKVELIFTTNSDSGARVYFSDSEGNLLFELMSKNGKLYAIGDSEVDTGIASINGKNNLYMELNLDTKFAKIVLNTNEIGSFSMSSKVNELASMTVATTKEDVILIGVQEVHMYKNYDVMDMFRLDEQGKEPFGWTVSNAVVENNPSCSTDTNSVKISGAGSATKFFDAVSNNFIYETFVLVPEEQSVSLALKNGENIAAKVDAVDNMFYIEGIADRAFSSNVWQLVRIEVDTKNKIAVYKINGKKVAVLPITEPSVTSIEISSSGVGDFWFDDVKLYNVYDYADYVSVPVPVNADDYIVGMSSCSLWREGKHYGWDYIAPYDTHTPVLGYYDEGLPEVADWEIKFQVEHGYDFQQYCWFVANQTVPMKKPRLSDALHDGYFNAKYSDMEKFAIMWENAGSKRVTYEYFINYIWPYWIDWYITDPRYMTIDNKPYVNLYLFNNFVSQMGGMDKAKHAIEFMDAECKKLGFDGIIIVFCNNLSGEDAARQIKSIGTDAVISYTLGEMSYDADYQKDGMTKYLGFGKGGGVSFLPSVGVGFNDIGWSGGRSPLATAEAHKDVLKWTKNTFMPMIAERETGNDSWMSRFVISTTWNEFGEGHFVFPTNVNGFGYIDAVRSEFSSVATVDDRAHFDVVPTLNQKARLGYLYPAENAPMKRLYLLENSSGVSGADYSKNVPALTWDFEKNGESLVSDWQGWNSKEISKMAYNEEEKAFQITTTGNDPSIRWNPKTKLELNANEGKILHVKMKASAGVTSSFELFWMSSNDTTYTGVKGINFKVLGNGEYNDYYFDLSSKASWTGEIASLRIDPIGEPCDVYIKTVEFLTGKVAGSTTITVDGASSEYAEEFIKLSEDEIFVAGEPDRGFYSLLNLYHEWDRWDNKLLVKTNDGTIIVFTVGSDTALVNGKEEKLSSDIDVVDGIVRVPLYFLCKKAGYDIEKDGDVYSITVREGLAERIEEESKKENWFEFNTTGDTQGWTVNNGQGSVMGGFFGFTASPVTGTVNGYDPSISHKALNIPTSHYKTVDFRMKVVLDDGVIPDTSKIYFATDIDSSLSESKTLRFNLADYEPDIYGYYAISLDASENPNWKGSVNQIRFDPTNFGGYYEIDYIRFIPDASYEAEKERLEAAEKEANELLYAVDDGAPFHIKNADAELASSNANLRKNTSIVEDELIEGNHAYLVVPENNDSKSWVYFLAPTRFKPGMTYRVSFDARVVADHNGNPAKDALLSWNMRYAETVDGQLRPTVDHFASFRERKLSTDDGWVHFEFEHTVLENIPDVRQYDCFALFMDPSEGGADGFINYSYMVDNIKVEAVG